MIDKKFWKNKKVLITGHTGFKGSWLTRILLNLKSEIIGVSLIKNKENFNHSLIKNMSPKLKEYNCDIKNKEKINKIFSKEKPEIVFHLAAQTLVINSYENPINTYETNINGTINIIAQLYLKNRIKSMIIVSSDKCYKVNKNNVYLKENDEMGGYDPYSSSKSSCELIISSLRNTNIKLPLTSVRAGNVIGGGDWNQNRLIPDIMKFIYINKKLILRNSDSVRPWQHVLEPINGYLILAEKIYHKKLNNKIIYPWNFGPSKNSHKKVKYILNFFYKKYNFNLKKILNKTPKFNETKTLLLSSSKSNKYLNWNNKLNFNQTLEYTNNWYNTYFNDKKNIEDLTNQQISNFFD